MTATAMDISENEVLRSGRREDIPALLETVGAAAEDHLRPPGLPEGGDPLLYYRRVFRLPKGTLGYRNAIIHEQDGEMTGFTIAAPLASFDKYIGETLPADVAHQRWGDLKTVLNWHIIVVKPEHRGKRVTHKLFAAVFNKAKKERYKYILGQLWMNNEPSRKMCLGCGMTFFHERAYYFEESGKQIYGFCDYAL